MISGFVKQVDSFKLASFDRYADDERKEKKNAVAMGCKTALFISIIFFLIPSSPSSLLLISVGSFPVFTLSLVPL